MHLLVIMVEAFWGGKRNRLGAVAPTASPVCGTTKDNLCSAASTKHQMCRLFVSAAAAVCVYVRQDLLYGVVTGWCVWFAPFLLGCVPYCLDLQDNVCMYHVLRSWFVVRCTCHDGHCQHVIVLPSAPPRRPSAAIVVVAAAAKEAQAAFECYPFSMPLFHRLCCWSGLLWDCGICHVHQQSRAREGFA